MERGLNPGGVCVVGPGGGRLLMVGQEAAHQGPLGALMEAARALEEQEQLRGRGGGLQGWGGWVRERGVLGWCWGCFV